MTPLTCAIVVEPNEIFRQGLVRIISQAGCPNCLGFQSSEQIEAAADPGWNTGLFLVNFGREGEDVARGVSVLKARRPESQIVVLSENYSHAQILGAIKAGASGYVLSSMGSEAFVKSLELIALGQHVIRPRLWSCSWPASGSPQTASCGSNGSVPPLIRVSSPCASRRS